MYEYKAKIISVHDGDTVRADIDLGFSIWQCAVSLRLSGINSPEIRGDTKAAGIASRDALRSRVLGKNVIIRTYKDQTEKYGRYLAEVFLVGENINGWMLKEGHAVAYEE